MSKRILFVAGSDPRLLSASHVIQARRRHCGALLAGCVFAAGVLALSSVSAIAGCNSGNTGTLLTSAACQAYGYGASATAVGAAAQATGPAGTAIGEDARASGGNSTAAGAHSRATGSNTTAIGFAAGHNLSVAGSTFVGAHSGSGRQSGLYATAVGAGADGDSAPRALGVFSIAIGGGNSDADPGARANSHYGIAIGNSSLAWEGTTAVGTLAGSDAQRGNEGYNSAFGYNAGRFAGGFQNTAIGDNSGYQVAGFGNVGLGSFAGRQVTGNHNIASGGLAGTSVNGSFNIAIGEHAGRRINASHTVAVGTVASASRDYAVAIGHGAWAARQRSVALGFGSVANAADTVSVGSDNLKRRIVNVAAAVNPSDAVNLAQLQAATAAMASTAAAAPASGGVTYRVDDIRRELAELRALVKQQQTLLTRQQAEIAELKGRKTLAATLEQD